MLWSQAVTQISRSNYLRAFLKLAVYPRTPISDFTFIFFADVRIAPSKH